MRQINSILLLATISFVDGGTPVAAQEEPLRDLINAQWKKYKEGLKDYQFREIASHYDLITGVQRIKFRTAEHRHRGEWKLYILESNEEDSGVTAINSHYAFRLEKDKPALSWRVAEIDLDVSDGVHLRGMGRKEHMEDSSNQYSPYVLGVSGFLPTFLNHPGVSVTKTEAAGIPEEGLRKIWFKAVADEISAKQKKSSPIEGAGWLILDPKCYWRIREFELPFLSPRTEKFRAVAKFQYAMAPADFPLLKQIEITYYPPGVSQKPDTRTVLDYVFEKRIPAEEEFRLSGFGFPEPAGTPPVGGGSRWYIWIALAGFGAFGVAFALRFVRRRYQNPDPANKPTGG